jgi:aconitate hydratase
VPPLSDIRNARVLLSAGRFDHDRPHLAGRRHRRQQPAGQYLIEARRAQAKTSTYGTRRGNDEVMVRGTFANIRIKNLMLNGVEGGCRRATSLQASK